jgi:hypothetical protein
MIWTIARWVIVLTVAAILGFAFGAILFLK